VQSLLSELARLDATGFYLETDTLAPRAARIRALSAAGDTLAVLEVGSGDEDRWIRALGDSIVYRLASWRVGRLLPDIEDLREGGEE
jgi:hypothetical protein